MKTNAKQLVNTKVFSVMKIIYILVMVLLCGCYGRASPTSCYNKYVRDGKGDNYYDTYEICLQRATARRKVVVDKIENPEKYRRHFIFRPIVVIQ